MAPDEESTPLTGRGRSLKRDHTKDQVGTIMLFSAKVKRKSTSSDLPTIELKDDSSSSSTLNYMWHMLTGSYLNLLLLLMPLAYASVKLQWSDSLIFWLNFGAMLPLASLLGEFTEELALHTNQTIGGLINASFGNAVEIVISIQALLANEIRVIQASLIGSIFSNLLLVQGCCFFFGGLKYPQQSFNSVTLSANTSLLMLSSLAFILPTPYAAYTDTTNEEVLSTSRITSIFLLLMYILLLVFQLKTHAFLLEDDNDEKPNISFWAAIIGLVSVTVLVSIFSEYLVSSIDGFVEGSDISKTFVGLIILPIVGNGVEHITAVTVARKDKMDLALGIAVGSCAQIALFVMPVVVIIGWMCDINMNLNYPSYEIEIYILAILISMTSTSSGTTNWLGGALLIVTYIMLAVGFYFEDVEDF
uniref:Sodium/calcium exchanger membrane region domain-containing protein n=2 Tax=Corethron hystrix TaxID=216773 RepID=A0A7S1BZT3_9STRA